MAKVNTVGEELEKGGWLDWALRSGIEPEIISYLVVKTSDFFNFSVTKPYATPRSWTYADQWLKMYKKGMITWEQFRKCLAGTLGPSVGENFAAFVMIGGAIVPIDVEKAKEEIIYEIDYLPPEVPIAPRNEETKEQSLIFLIASGYRPDLYKTLANYKDGYTPPGSSVVIHFNEMIHYILTMSIDMIVSVKYALISSGMDRKTATEIACDLLSRLWEWSEEQYKELDKIGEVTAQVTVHAIQVIIEEKYKQMLGCK